MEGVYYAARANLRRLMRLHPDWTQPPYAQAVGMELCWVKKWKKRLQEADPKDEPVLHSRSRARKHPPERISPTVTERIIEMRDEPPEGLQRTPGPKAILSYLPRDPDPASVSACHAPAGPSLTSCNTPDASPTGCPTCKRSWRARPR